MSASRAPTDYGQTPYAVRAREEKAADLEMFARELGYRADDLVRHEVRVKLLERLAQSRGKRPSQVRASVDTWRLVWRYLRDQEKRSAMHGFQVPAGSSR